VVVDLGVVPTALAFTTLA